MIFLFYAVQFACGVSTPLFAMWLTAKFLTPKKGRKLWLVLRYAMFLLALNMVIYIADPVNILYTLPFFVLGMFFLYTDDRIPKLAITLVLYPLIMSLNAMIDNSRILFYYFFQPLRFAVWLGILLAARHLLREERYTLSPRLWKLIFALALLPMSATISIVALSRYGYYDIAEKAIGYTVLPFAFFSALVLLYAITILYQHEKNESENQLYQIRALYWNNIEREQTQLRRLRHDMANHFTALSGLLDAGENQKALEYLRGLQAAARPQAARYCAHPTVNAVLAAKAAAAEEAGLLLQCTAHLPGTLPLSDLDLAALFGNALDNAIEAAQEAEEKTITLRTRADKGMLMIRVQNAYHGSRQKQGGRFDTTKSDPRAHGFGLKTMETIAQRYCGSLEAKAENGVFDLVIVIPVKS